jgi:hypothetical protein
MSGDDLMRRFVGEVIAGKVKTNPLHSVLAGVVDAAAGSAVPTAAMAVVAAALDVGSAGLEHLVLAARDPEKVNPGEAKALQLVEAVRHLESLRKAP